MKLRAIGGLFVCALAGAAFAPVASAASPTCTGSEQLISWPVGAPVWEFCYTAYGQSAGPRGSGLDLRKVYYNGRLVLKEAHAPMLFAEYTTGLCYRDWKDDAAAFMAEPAVRNQVGTSVNFSATTSCDRSNSPTQAYGTCPFQIPGRSAADCFNTNPAPGVAFENKGDHLLVTAQYDAAWYQYTSRFAFYLDGSFEPEFGFGNSDGTNNGITHWHHNYWRLDFDIEGSANDTIRQDGVVQATEFSALRCNAATNPSCASERRWSVVDTVTGRGYELIPSSDDYITPTNQSGGNRHTTDVMGTIYQAGQFGDNPNYNLSDCTMNTSALVNSEDLDGAAGAGTDVVLWYRVGVRDVRDPSTNPPTDVMICKKAGPAFRPVGDWGNGSTLLIDGFE